MAFLQRRIKLDSSDYFGIPLRASAITTVLSKLRPHDAHADSSIGLGHLAATPDMLSLGSVVEAAGAAEHKKLEAFLAGVRNMVFCRLVRQRPSRLIRHRVCGGKGFDPSDCGVTLHEVMDVNAAEEALLVDVESRRLDCDSSALTMVLTLSAFPVEALVRARLWSLKGDDTTYIMDKHGFGSIVPEECGGVLPGLLRDLLEAQVGSEGELEVPKVDDADVSLQRSEILEAFQEAGLITEVGSKFKVTTSGRQCFRVCCEVSAPKRAAWKRPGIALEECTVWELIIHLDVEGFSHTVKKTSKYDASFDPKAKEPRKLWYSAPGQVTVARSYLLALATGQHTVPHWHTAGFYDALLAGVPYVKKSRRKKFKFTQAVDDWGDGGVEQDARPRDEHKKPRVPKTKVANAGAMLDAESESDGSESSVSSPSSSSSSSSSTEKNEEQSQLEDEGQAGRRARAGAGGIDLGLNHLTKVFDGDDNHVGWEVKCNHPGHQTPIACRKNLRLVTRKRTKDMTYLMVRAWLFR